ncbi:hypothetical protein HMPREF1624_07680 [Sporothrix schenckii ATCC 58251]|uniref:HNH nuclease domain-containing protein n=1 Tax=Sporothrix schenckii (strain ATCC 58251 / de Perez 2211183) TaxID=1391915 RepID=U7PN21_SPOS1|nr:hypothetical protein HMPREF1624_07680 [Sporothrix schenckii ATCC 58251]
MAGKAKKKAANAKKKAAKASKTYVVPSYSGATTTHNASSVDLDYNSSIRTTSSQDAPASPVEKNEPQLPSDPNVDNVQSKASPEATDTTTRATTRQSRFTLRLAGPVTPVKGMMQIPALTPTLRQAMSAEDVAEHEAIQKTPLCSQTPNEKAEKDGNVAKIIRAFRNMEEDERVLADRYADMTNKIVSLKENWEEGGINLPTARYKAEMAPYLAKQKAMAISLSVLRSKSTALVSGWATDIVSEGIKRDMAEDWVMIDAVLRCYPELEGARKTVRASRAEMQRNQFRKKLVGSYGGDALYDGKLVYCPIAHTHMPDVVAAHIVNASVGPKTAEALFGERQDHIWNPRNGLLVCKGYEELLDKAKAIILPASDDPEETEFVLHLLTRNLGERNAIFWTYEDLHRRPLKFLNGFRPARKYLYFKAIVSLLRRQRAEIDECWANLDNLPPVAKSYWGSPGKYLRNSILYVFAREYGILTAADAKLFWGVDAADVMAGLSIDDKKTAQALATQATAAVFAREDEEKESNDDDNDDDDADDDYDNIDSDSDTDRDVGKRQGKAKTKGKGKNTADNDDPFLA